MKHTEHCLVDEAIASEPVKNTFRLAWEYIKLNQTFTLTAMIILMVLNVFGTIPAVSLIFMVLSALFSFLIQIDAGKTFYKSPDIRSYLTSIEEKRLDTVVRENSFIAFGAYLGWIVLFFLILLLFSALASGMGVIGENFSHINLTKGAQLFTIPLLLMSLLFSYVQPLVQANIIMANDFKEGFKAVFTLFSMDLWRSSLSKSYFKYVASFGLATLIILFIAAFLIGLLTNLIGLVIVGNLLMVLLMYVFMVIIAIASIMSHRVIAS